MHSQLGQRMRAVLDECKEQGKKIWFIFYIYGEKLNWNSWDQETRNSSQKQRKKINQNDIILQHETMKPRRWWDNPKICNDAKINGCIKNGRKI